MDNLSFILYPLSFILYPLFFILYSLFFILMALSLWGGNQNIQSQTTAERTQNV